MNSQEIEQYTVFRCIAGSKAYGTATDQSDLDVRGVFIAPPEYILGCLKSVEQVEIGGEDTVIYELSKFTKLAAESNPNIIELLYTDEENILSIDPAFALLRENRHLFLSKKARYTFSGYAVAQLKRIRGHNKWISNPQAVDPPQLLDFAQIIYPNGTIIQGHALETLGAVFLVKINASVYRIFQHPDFHRPPLSEDKQNIQFVDMEEEKLQRTGVTFLGTLIVQEETYDVQHRMWKDYWKWKRERNEVRAKLEEAYTYDCKHASHLVRLLRMSHEILKEGKVIVRRPDAAELLDIRNGKWTYEELIATAERMDAELEGLYDSSTLQHSADKEAINKLYMDIVLKYWKERGLI